MWAQSVWTVGQRGPPALMSDTRFLASAQGSVLTVLRAQHVRLRELLAEVRGADDHERRAAAFEALRELLAAHETAEEIVLRPVSAKVMSRTVTTARNREEHAIVKLLAELEGTDVAGAEFGERFVAFEHAVLEHLSLEESEEFPVIEELIDPHESGVMARWIERATALGPTHPHPAAVGSPMVRRVVAPFTALLDHTRDLFDGSRDDGQSTG
jgi:Hemerythrin HHE cation binding domain